MRVWLLITLIVLFVVSAIEPRYPQDFVVEHVLTIIGVASIIWFDRKYGLSLTSAWLVFAFLVLHVVGAHYTYSEVPYEAWSDRVFGTRIGESLGWRRNNYDRLVHLMFGVLLVYPTREYLRPALPSLTNWTRTIAAVLVLALLSQLYELLEWTFTLVMTKEAAATYNGEQGDLRDAHKDMALALGGMLFSASVTLLGDWRRGRVEKR